MDQVNDSTLPSGYKKRCVKHFDKASSFGVEPEFV